jgi:hypothetical protein
MVKTQFKVLNTVGETVASCIHAEDAACLVALYGDGAQIRHGSRLVWHEGQEDQSANESYDHVATVAIERTLQRLGVVRVAQVNR